MTFLTLRTALCAAGCATMLAAASPAQQGWTPSVLRLDGGLLDPDAPVKGVGALGVTAGWSASRANTVLLRLLQQLRDRTASIYVADHARTFVFADWEHAFGQGEQQRSQFSTRLGVGVLSSSHWPAAMALGGGLALRHPIGGRLTVAGRVEDNVAILPHRDGVGCYNAGGTIYCSVPPTGGWQHNFGVLAGVEWWPGGRRFGTARSRLEPPAFTPAPPSATETGVGAVCSRLTEPTGALVRVRMFARDSGEALLIRRGSDVGSMVRCGEGALVLGPSPALTSQVVIPEPWISQVWVRRNQAVLGTLVGAGSGAAVGLLLGSAKSYLCNGVACAKHQGTSTLIGAAVGGAVGWLLGSVTSRWARRYP